MNPADVHLVCIAKDPRPGRVKTRLTTRYSPEQAASLAAAALIDTLTAMAKTPAACRTLVLSGDARRWRGFGAHVIAQRGEGLDERLAAALDDAWARHSAPLLLIGMDTPQVDPVVLAAAAGSLVADGVDAVLGGAEDGGFWCLGLRRPNPALLVGVPMSTPDTGRKQRDRLLAARLKVLDLPVLRDVDTPSDCLAIADLAPATRFAGAVRRTESDMPVEYRE